MRSHRQTQHTLLRGKRVAITGGTSGLGLALVKEFSDAGANVAFVARTAEHVAEVSAHHRCVGIVGDVADKHAIHPIAMQIAAQLDGLDILINNASALGPTPLRLLADTDCEQFEHAIATNVLGPFRLTKALLGSLAASAREGRGAIVVNISSDAAVNAYPNWGAYSASKAALAHMTRIWDAELAPEGISFLSFDPGDMDTPLHSAAIPEADRNTLKRPETAARELVGKLVETIALRDRPLALLKVGGAA